MRMNLKFERHSLKLTSLILRWRKSGELGLAKVSLKYPKKYLKG